MTEMCISYELSIIAILIALLSAIYSRRMWEESKRANDISMLGGRKEVYDAYDHLKNHLKKKGQKSELAEVTKFHYPCRDSKVYFYNSSELISKLEEYYDICFKIADFNGLELEDHEIKQVSQFLESEKNLSKKLDNLFSKELSIN